MAALSAMSSGNGVLLHVVESSSELNKYFPPKIEFCYTKLETVNIDE
jgi:hypothetical protein